ncbi:hypothetical protein [Fictibacillus barbaricus]|uniref:Lipoprotein n=1 Tax=Fictibacillus barbaricus TaxID=182136 RepID=A0ABU1TXF8_9BACL|nr:hypothetical protein [Fictibacillus barbaricus]MDR7071905.1 hypothetical protein [Fictibacillus barbaricus]
MTNKTGIKCALVIMAVILSACSNNQDSKPKDVKHKTAATAPKKEQNENKSDKKEEAATDQTAIQIDGTYVGQIDNNSIEVEADGEILVLRLTDETRKLLAALKDGATVSVTYKKDENDQNILEKIVAVDSDEVEQPPTKTLEYTIDGKKIRKEAALIQSEQGYSFYKVDDFEFTAEEPGKDLLFASPYAETFVRIEPVADDASIDDLKKWANDELEAVGEVKEVKSSEVAGPGFANTELFITASKDSYTKYIVIQKQQSGKMVKYTVNLPKHDKSKEWEQEIWAMLSTLKMK